MRKGDIEKAWESLREAIKFGALTLSQKFSSITSNLPPNFLFVRANNSDKQLDSVRGKKLENLLKEEKIKLKVEVHSYSHSDNSIMDLNGLIIDLKRDNEETRLFLKFPINSSNGKTMVKEKRMLGELLYHLLNIPNVQTEFETPVLAYLPYTNHSEEVISLTKKLLLDKKNISFLDVENLKGISFAFIDTGKTEKLRYLLNLVLKSNNNDRDFVDELPRIVLYITALVEYLTLVNGPNAALRLLSEKKLKKFLNNVRESSIHNTMSVFREEMEVVVVRTLIKQGKLDDAEDIMRRLRISKATLGNELVKELIKHNKLKAASRLISEFGLYVQSDSLECVLAYWLRNNNFDRFYLIWMSIPQKKAILRDNIGREVGRYLVRKYFSA